MFPNISRFTFHDISLLHCTRSVNREDFNFTKFCRLARTLSYCAINLSVVLGPEVILMIIVFT